MKHDHTNKKKEEKTKYVKGKQVLKVSIDSDEEKDNEEALNEFCFTAIEDGVDVEENDEL